MVKRIRKRSRRYRKKSYRKRSFKRRFKKTAYDGVIYVKCYADQGVYYNSTLQCAPYTFNWGSTDTTTNGTTYNRITNSTEFNRFTQIFQEWKLKGVSYKWIPHNGLNGGTVAVSYVEGHMCHCPTAFMTGASSQDTMRQQSYYKTFKAGSMLKGYVNCARHYRKLNKEWVNTSTYYPTASTHFQFETWGYANGDLIGRMEVCYYVMFKGNKTDQGIS